MTKLNTYSEDLKTHIDELEEQILQVLAKQNTNIRELVRELGEDKEVVIGQIRKLLDEGKIQYVSTLELGVTGKS